MTRTEVINQFISIENSSKGHSTIGEQSVSGDEQFHSQDHWNGKADRLDRIGKQQSLICADRGVKQSVDGHAIKSGGTGEGTWFLLFQIKRHWSFVSSSWLRGEMQFTNDFLAFQVSRGGRRQYPTDTSKDLGHPLCNWGKTNFQCYIPLSLFSGCFGDFVALQNSPAEGVSVMWSECSGSLWVMSSYFVVPLAVRVRIESGSVISETVHNVKVSFDRSM